MKSRFEILLPLALDDEYQRDLTHYPFQGEMEMEDNPLNPLTTYIPSIA